MNGLKCPKIWLVCAAGPSNIRDMILNFANSFSSLIFVFDIWSQKKKEEKGNLISMVSVKSKTYF